MQTYLDLHFSDYWTDPSHQTTPVSWSQTSIDDLCATVYTYTQTVSNEFARAKIYPIIISIGNEIENGLLWPLGEISKPSNIARLLHSASEGIRSSALSSTTKIMLHTSNGWHKSMQLWFYKTILSFGTFTLNDFDIFGFSFYPFQGPEATFSALKDTLEAFENKYPGKELVIAETNWPFSCPSPRSAFPSEANQIPFSQKGQIEWVKNISDLLDSVKGGAGLFYWEAAWTSNANLGSACADNLLFDPTGKARDSVDMFSLV
ncbi:hypothetical protein CROQUDRAFT_658976 [Cronartium quercuum f. sp. fusiforme G11]|uniref:Arabinogalactan endo-beta-1,4-galactanase n=1 Tax=Cronartium quercuum f. sp. fusiforme G11 TaxID=708437 RepID=A0A9P6TB07_9BASI|nr:hypothetical protein CROQUDRAFT_658976 [Cronartium quercuum f. sp. fusiforme G11]